MHSQFVKVIGLMSGTSLDGLDIVCVEFDKNQEGSFKIIYSETTKYSQNWEQRLREGISKNKQELIALDEEYAVLLADKIADFILKFKIKDIDFIASHGHTILHKPNEGYTLQIGNGAIISQRTNLKVICDFRTQDVKLGGQGAPLVPIGDELLFSQYDACLNLGGFANISFKKGDSRIAFDICPVNIVLNHYVQKLGFEYDDKGKLASEGEIDASLLKKLNELPFYKKQHPKSLGLEWVHEQVLPLIASFDVSIPIILRTFVEHVAIQITNSLNGKNEVLATGGGVFNSFLIERIKVLSTAKIIIPPKSLIDYKEALIFAFLGVLRSENQVNCLKSVTGACKDHSSGVIFYP